MGAGIGGWDLDHLSKQSVYIVNEPVNFIPEMHPSDTLSPWIERLMAQVCIGTWPFTGAFFTIAKRPETTCFSRRCQHMYEVVYDISIKYFQRIAKKSVSVTISKDKT